MTLPDGATAVKDDAGNYQPQSPALPVTPDAIASAIDAMLDALAVSWGYDDKTSIATYLSSAVPTFKAQAAAFCAYRDAVWSQAAADLLAVQSGAKPMPASVSAYLATLPAAPVSP